MDHLRESIYFLSNNENTMFGSLEVDNNPSNIGSDYVHNLANGIYKEFESLILHYGENVVKNLMPMVVSCLETLDRVYSEKHNIEVEFELLKEDSSQLMTQYEREKHQRKNAEENYFKSEDTFYETSKRLEDEIQKLKSVQKMHEIRLKNSQEHVTRLEKRESERQSEFDKLLTRYHELLRYNRDYLEKPRNFHGESKKYKMKFSNDCRQDSVCEVLNISDLNQTEHINTERILSDELAKESSEFHNNMKTFPPYDWDFISTKSDDENFISDSEEISTGVNILPLDDELAGMTYEIESIIKENNDLIATKNALNIVKDDLISKLDEANSEIEILQHENNSLNTMKTSLKLRINNLEIENKGLRQEVTLLQHKTEDDKDEDSVPISLRKRFTRLEMARVLMERNKYKEKLLEMEEYVKWSKMLKNKKERKLSIWERFSRLFKSNNQFSNEKGNSISDNIPENLIKDVHNLSTNNQNVELTSNCCALRDPNRQQVNGWSLPAGTPLLATSDLPVPIYCRPLSENQIGLKITCAVTVNVSGGCDMNGDKFVGSSIFYDSQFDKPSVNPDLLEIEEKMNQGYTIKEFGKFTYDTFKTKFNSDSHVWVCTSCDNQSQIIVIDANKPADYLDAFIIPNSPVQSLGSVPGANSKDYAKKSIAVSIDVQEALTMEKECEHLNDLIPKFKVTQVDCTSHESRDFNIETDKNMKISDITITRKFNSSFAVPNNCNEFDSISSEKPGLFENSSIQPTIWIGCRNGDLFVHPATGNRSLCLNHIRLPDSITNIIHQNSRVFVSLANGSIIIFCRYMINEGHDTKLIGQWKMSKYYFLEPENYNHSIRCLESVPLTNKIWIGFRNQVMVIDDSSLAFTISFEAHPRADYTVRQMCCAGDGVWLSLRLDTTLRLFHIYNYQHLQDLNMEPHINKLLEPSLLGLSLLRITCLSTSCHRLWIGTNKGMIISAPFLSVSKNENQMEVINDLLSNCEGNSKVNKDNLCSPTFIPFINHEELQLSYHGHRDSVKFFTTVRCADIHLKESQIFLKSDVSPTKSTFLIMSGGEGYKDFRQTEKCLNLNSKNLNSKSKIKSEESTKTTSHLIVWQLSKKIID